MISQMVPLSLILDPLGGLNLSYLAYSLNPMPHTTSVWPLRSFDYGFLEAIIRIHGGRTYNRLIKTYDHIGSHILLKAGP